MRKWKPRNIPLKIPLEKTRELNINGAEPFIDLKIGDRHLCHFLEERSGTAYYIDQPGKYRITLNIEKIGEPDSEDFFS